ncbi:MAG: EAL domain-containing protein [Lachnospiraceae bacterium]|nr:EAL domain-containing protein [Lachnospiraceae bacterium]
MSDKVIGRVHKIDLRKLNAKKSAEPQFDALTGLYTREHFRSCVNKCIHEHKDFSSALIVVDVDNFKAVNENLGHAFGDEVLRGIGRALSTCIASGDIIGRIGGDEFIIFIKKYNTQEQIIRTISKISARISSVYVGEMEDFSLSVTCGIALHPDNGESIDLLYDNACKALVYAKYIAQVDYAFYQDDIPEMVNAPFNNHNPEDYTTFNIDCPKIYDQYGLTNMAFKLMEDTKDVDSTINLMLHTLADHYGLSIIFIREITENPRELEYIYECVTGNYNRLLGTRCTYTEEEWHNFINHYDNGYFLFDDISHLPSSLRDSSPFVNNVKTVLEIPIYNSGSFAGCVEFVSITRHKEWAEDDINTLKMFCRILSSYLLSMRTLKRTEDLVTELTQKDSLTGLMKYETFINSVREFASKNTDPNIGIAIVYSDIKYFKAINDKFGYSVGDKMLKHFGNAVRNSGEYTFAACRLFSDNIITAGIYDNSFDKNEFAKIIHEYNHKIEDELQKLFFEQRIIINSGIYICHDTRNLDVEIAISNANLARKKAKNIDSTEPVLFTPDMISNLLQHMELCSNLHTAIENEELKVFYQPKVECGSEKVIGAEALVRWFKPDGSCVLPDSFIPLFESNGLIVEVDYFVYRKVFEHLRKRLDEELPVVPISMNVSRAHLASDGILEYIKTLFDTYQIPPELVEFELTENIYIENMTAVLPLIHHMRDLGVKISMDDFGAGHSSLNELNRLPLDTIKLDRVFMSENLNEKQRIILSSIVEMSKKLNIAVLCEGVENDSQNEFLRKIGCDMVQGYYYSQPLSEEEFVEYIKTRLAEDVNYTHFAFDNSLWDDNHEYQGFLLGHDIRYTSGPAGTSALYFGGGSTSTNVVELPINLYPVSNYTITMWFKEDEDQIGSSIMYTSFEKGYSNIIPHNADYKALFRIKEVTGDNDNPTDAHGVIAPKKNVWNFLAVSYNYRTRTSNLYINGLPAGRVANAPILGSPIRILLGGDIYSNCFKGAIADLRIYNQELSSTEILYTFNSLSRS